MIITKDKSKIESNFQTIYNLIKGFENKWKVILHWNSGYILNQKDSPQCKNSKSLYENIEYLEDREALMTRLEREIGLSFGLAEKKN